MFRAFKSCKCKDATASYSVTASQNWLSGRRGNRFWFNLHKVLSLFRSSFVPFTWRCVCFWETKLRCEGRVLPLSSSLSFAAWTDEACYLEVLIRQQPDFSKSEITSSVHLIAHDFLFMSWEQGSNPGWVPFSGVCTFRLCISCCIFLIPRSNICQNISKTSTQLLIFKMPFHQPNSRDVGGL